MPLKIQRPFICLSCQRRLALETEHYYRTINTFRATRPRFSNSARTSLYLTRAFKSYSRAYNNENENDDLDSLHIPKVHGWRALLDTKSLGQDSSVIVLRDSEGKRSVAPGLIPVEPAEEESRNDTVNDLYSLIQKEKLQTQQKDVDRYIELIRAEVNRGSREDGAAITLDLYEKAMRKLLQSFTYRQLFNYSTSQLAKTSTTHESNSSISFPVQDVHGHRFWTPQEDRTLEDALSRYKTWPNPPGIKKTRLADRIVRHMWGFQIDTILGSMGSAFINVDANKLRALVPGGQTSPVSKIGERLHVKLQIVPQLGNVTISANKFACDEALQALTAALSDVSELEFIVDHKIAATILKLPKHEWLKSIQSLAETSRCFASFQKSTKKSMTAFKVYGQNVKAVHRFQRMLLALVYEIGRTQDMLPIDPIKGRMNLREAGTYLCPIADASLTLSFRDRKKQWGRASVSHSISAGSTPAHTGYPAVKALSTASKDIRKNLLSKSEPDDYRHESSSHWRVHEDGRSFKVEFGHVLLEMKKSEEAGMTKIGTQKSKVPRDLAFSAAVTGALQLLQNHFSETSWTETSTLRIHLVPNILTSTAKYRPHILEMVFAVDAEQQRVTLERVVAVMDACRVLKALPGFCTDVRFTSTQEFELNNPQEVPEIQRYMHQIQDAVAGYSRIDPPSRLILKVPQTWTQVERKNSMTDMDKEKEATIEYAPIRLDHHQSVVFKYDNAFDLMYDKVQEGDMGGTYETLSLQSQRARVADGKSVNKDEVVVDALFKHTGSLVQQLNDGLRHTNLLNRRTLNSEIGGAGNNDKNFISGSSRDVEPLHNKESKW